MGILESQHERAIKTFGVGHPHLIQFEMILALLLGETGRAQEGVEVAKELLARANEIDSPDTTELLSLQLLLLTMHMYADDEEPTISAIRDYLDLRATISDDADEFTIALHHELVSLLTASGRYPDAAEACINLLASQLELRGRETTESLTTRYHLVDLYRQYEQWDLAIDTCEALIDHCAVVLQPNDPRTLTIRSYLARLLMDSDRLSIASKKYEELILDLNEQDLEVRQSALSQLALCYRRLGDFEGLIGAYGRMVENLLSSVPQDVFEASEDDIFRIRGRVLRHPDGTSRPKGCCFYL